MADTIAAIATGDILSAIGIIRISGSESIAVMDRLFKSFTGKIASEFESRKLYYGEIKGAQDRVLDRCLCTISKAPHSYTGEDTAEIQCHGSPVVLREILNALFALGVRQAMAGEFTKRAFLNGQMDLVQAEAVIDLINAETAEIAVNAAGQLGGAVSQKTDGIYDSLTNIMAHFHAVLDYSDEDIEPFQIDEYLHEFETHINQLKQLEASFKRGNVMKNGVKGAIIGKPNVGKSSLLNALLGYDRAIVTDIPGTTRDTVEERVRLGNVLIRITDTAGLRDTSDAVEQIGVERSRKAAAQSELVLAVFDSSRPLDEEDREVIEIASCVPESIAIFNKTDLPKTAEIAEIEDKFSKVCSISALNQEGIEELGDVIGKLYNNGACTDAGEILTNSRHYDVVKRARGHIENAVNALKAGMTPDAILTDIEDAMEALGEMTGRTIREDVTSRIFERFCVGK